jgi:hypothetical protein
MNRGLLLTTPNIDRNDQVLAGRRLDPADGVAGGTDRPGED